MLNTELDQLMDLDLDHDQDLDLDQDLDQDLEQDLDQDLDQDSDQDLDLDLGPTWSLTILEDNLIEPLDNVDPAVDNEDDTCQEDLGNINIASSENVSRF